MAHAYSYCLRGFYYIDTGVKFIQNCIRDLTSFPAFSQLFVFGWLSVYVIKGTLHVSPKI